MEGEGRSGPGVELADEFAIHRLIALYGHVVDAKAWERLGEIFTEDVVFDSTAFGSRLRRNLDELRDDWSDPATRHPLAHHGTNVVIDANGDGTVTILSKGLGLRPGGKIGSVTYTDLARRTAAGWRISRRVAVPRPTD